MPHPYSSTSCWMHSITAPLSEQKLNANAHGDVCIIGAGIVGLTTAYYLLRQGKNVIILDKERIGYGQTALSTGHLTYALDDRYFELERLFGLQGSILAGNNQKKVC